MKDKNAYFYVCEVCLRTFQADPIDYEIAKKEAEKVFGKHPEQWKDTPAYVCDDCYKKIDPAKFPELVEEAKKFI